MRNAPGEREALDQHHYEHTGRDACATGLLEAIDRTNIRMIQGGVDFGLALETGHAFGIGGKRFWQDLQHDFTAELWIARYTSSMRPALSGELIGAQPKWDASEDLSLLKFKAIRYRPKENAVADDEQLARIAKVLKREFIRRGINQHTLEEICRQESVRAITFAKCLEVLEEYEAGKAHPSERDRPGNSGMGYQRGQERATNHSGCDG